MLRGNREQNPAKRWLASCPSRGEAASSATGALVWGGGGGGLPTTPQGAFIFAEWVV